MLSTGGTQQVLPGSIQSNSTKTNNDPKAKTTGVTGGRKFLSHFRKPSWPPREKLRALNDKLSYLKSDGNAQLVVIPDRRETRPSDWPSDWPTQMIDSLTESSYDWLTKTYKLCKDGDTVECVLIAGKVAGKITA